MNRFRRLLRFLILLFLAIVLVVSIGLLWGYILIDLVLLHFFWDFSCYGSLEFI